MRWRGREESKNIEDRRGRGMSAGGAAIGGVGALVLLVLGAIFGIDVQPLLQGGGPQAAVDQGGQVAEANPAQEEARGLVAVVLKDTEDVWHEQFRLLGKQYSPPGLVFYDDRTPTDGCGSGAAAMGPFYCPADQKVYIDLSFFEELKRRHGAPGDFAQAYVIAHEVGHHVQNLLGTSTAVRRKQASLRDKAAINDLSVRLELQADFYAGLWAHHAQRTKQILEEGDVQEALQAAAAIGDDRLQKQARGFAQKETFTHGSSSQRMAWFVRGLKTGDIDQGDTFSVSEADL